MGAPRAPRLSRDQRGRRHGHERRGPAAVPAPTGAAPAAIDAASAVQPIAHHATCAGARSWMQREPADDRGRRQPLGVAGPARQDLATVSASRMAVGRWLQRR